MNLSVNIYVFILISLEHHCFAKNSYIKGPPTILGDKELLKKTGTEGKDIKFTCPAVGNPEPIIEWSKGEEAIPDEAWERFRVVKNSLKIKGLKPNDQGKYVCKAVNGFGSVRFTFYLNILASLGNVLSSPAGDELRMDQVFPVSGSTIRKMPGQSVRFKCLATGNPTPEITWLKDGHILDPSVIRSDVETSFPDFDAFRVMQHSLPLTRLTPEDSGNYTCHASNIHGVVTANWTLNVEGQVPVEGPESFPLEMPNVTTHTGEEAVLSCRGTWDAQVTPKVMWLRQVEKTRLNAMPPNQTFPYKGKHYQVLQPTELLLLDNGFFMTKLVVEEAKSSDSGLYVCTVSNRYGINVRQANLTVLPAENESSPVLLLAGVAMGVVALVVGAVAISLCQRKSKPSPPTGPTERALIPSQGGAGGHAKLQPAPSSHQPRYVIHHSTGTRSHPAGSEQGMFQYPSSVVHVAAQPAQGTEPGVGGGQEQPIIIYQDPTLAGSVYLASHQGTSTTQPAKYEYRQFDVI